MFESDNIFEVSGSLCQIISLHGADFLSNIWQVVLGHLVAVARNNP